MAHQRPKLDRYDDVLFVVLRAARYLDEQEEVEFGEIHVFLGPNFVVTVGTTAAGSGVGGVFNLGRSNTVNATTTWDDDGWTAMTKCSSGVFV